MPMFEKPDETRHVEYVRFLARERRLPRPLPVAPFHEETHWQGVHAPLPHAVAAVVLIALDPAGRNGLASDPTAWLARPMPDSPPPDAPGRWPRLNPRAFLPADWDLNRFERDPRDRFPWRPPYTLLRGLRLFSLVWGVATVWMTHATAVLALGPGPWAALATWLVALHPQHAFMVSAVGNTGATATFGILAAWLGLRHVWLGVRGRPTCRAFVLGLATGSGLLTRINGAGVGLFAAACAWCAARRPRRAIGPTLAVGAGALLAAGWWFARNQALAGDPLGWRRFHVAAAVAFAPQPFWSPYFLSLGERGFLSGAFGSFWGRFGWMTIPLSPVVVGALAALCLAAAAGLLPALWRPGPRRLPLRLLLLHAMATFALFVWFNHLMPEPQGRYLFPSLAPLMILLAAGIQTLAGKARWPAWAAVALVAAADVDAFRLFADVYR